MKAIIIYFITKGEVALDNVKNFFLKNKALSITAFIMAVIIIMLTAGIINVQGEQVGEITEYRQKVKEFETDIAALSDEKASLEKENSELSDKVTEYEQTVSKLNKQVAEFSGYRDTYKELENKYNSLKTDYDKISAENVSLKKTAETKAAVSSASSKAPNASAESGTSDSGGNSNLSADKNKSYTVYITKTGGKYHSGGCRYLRKSKISISKDSAVAQGYSPCDVCNP